MSDHDLREAFGVLRERHRGEHPDAAASLHAVLRKTHERQRSRSIVRHLLLPAAAMLAASTAWASATGRLAPAVRSMLDVVQPEATPLHVPAPVMRRAVGAPSQQVPAQNEPEAASSPAPAPATSVAEDPHAARFAHAHRIHFVEQDPARAVEAWNAYLRAAPHGRFVPEARYNRAIALLRLGRNGEARRDLEAFASGSYGGYRREEARALLDALPDRR